MIITGIWSNGDIGYGPLNDFDSADRYYKHVLMGGTQCAHENEREIDAKRTIYQIPIRLQAGNIALGSSSARGLFYIHFW